MRPLRLLSFALPILLAGCGGGGGGGCTDDVAIVGVAAYAGHYSATFTPTAGTTATQTYDLTVDASGGVAGTAADAGAGASTSVTGGAGDLRSGCALAGTAFNVSATQGVRLLRATRSGRGTLVGSYGGTLQTTSGNIPGTLVVTQAIGGG